jgi:hypothetical protein
MSSPSSEPRNPFYLLLLLASLVFVLTALACVFVPLQEEKARQAGKVLSPSWFHDAFREDGIKWLLYEVAVMIVVGLASMGLDRWRRYQKEQTEARLPAAPS